jgi:hypothetical protein
MRRVPVPVVVVLLFTAGCSLVWDMEAYEPSGARDGGTTSGSSSGASNGAPSVSAGDAAHDDTSLPATCSSESEPNESREEALEVAPGKTCAELGEIGDTDYWLVTATEQVSVTVTIKAGMQFVVLRETEAPTIHTAPTNLVLPAGSHVIFVQSANGTIGEYTIER